ncbi:MAG: DUF4416 family protein [Planctomycetaceae bacterium]|nr:DUF4416 family protein [Planctomycetaceae bacterium]
MATPRFLEQAVFFCGLLAAGRDELAAGAEALVQAFGPARCGSRVWRFDNTEYYRDELGPRPVRAFLAWEGAFDTTDLAQRKLLTNAMEIDLASRLGGALTRPVNLDPGYLTLAKVVLASAKNYAHRIHLRDGIFAEVTLQYRGGRLRPLPWTFPDYGSGRYDGFLLAVRQTLALGVSHGNGNRSKTARR